MTSRTFLAAGGALAATLLCAAAAGAQTPAKPAVTPGLQAVFDCRKLADSAARLACFEQSVGRLESALTAREVMVVDREQARAARREAFGFSLPSLNIFDRVQGGDELEELTLTVESASQDGGRWTVRMTNGQVWRQTQATPGYLRIRSGSKAELRRGLLGSYFMKVDGRPGIRAERVR